MEKQAKPKILVFVNNHFDPIWRRCWDRRFLSGGESYVSYAEIQDYYLSDNLELARTLPDYKFEAESAVVLRKHLERHPERKDEFAKLAKERRFTVSGAGDNIVDSNMILGESLVRNFLYGLLWVEETLGVKTSLGMRKDAFGNSAQLPQIFRGCEIERVSGLNYSVPQGDFFKGLDGSSVATGFLPIAAKASSVSKYAPCRKCAGKGCDACSGRGIEGSRRTVPPERLELAEGEEAAAVMLCPEEILPCMDIGSWAERMRQNYDIRFAIGEDAMKLLDTGKGVTHPGVELNPNNTGCYVTRIKLKQECRRLEYAALGAETLWSAALLGGRQYPMERLRQTWRNLLFTMFHDAITGTHIDAAYEELMDMNASIDRELSGLSGEALEKLVEADDSALSAINPRGCKFTGIAKATIKAPCPGEGLTLHGSDGTAASILNVEKLDNGRISVEFLAKDVPAFSSKAYRIAKAPAPKPAEKPPTPVIENSRFRISADQKGILSIYDKKLDVEICKPGGFRPCEAILESDEGSPWATLRGPLDRFAGPSTTLASVESGDGRQSMAFNIDFGPRTFTGGHPFLAQAKATLIEGLERIDFSIDVERWDAFNARVRFAFPLAFDGAGLYGIPYGALRRDAYEPTYEWDGANGDWPAINWCGVEGGKISAAIFNKGTPSCKIEAGRHGGKTITVSVLRSPTTPTYLHEPWEYTMTGFQGMRDQGRHRFEFALCAYAGKLLESQAADDAEAFNAGVFAVQGKAKLPEMPSLEPGCARMSSIKAAEKGCALIVRLAEFRGQGGTALLKLPKQIKSAARVNLLEREATNIGRNSDGLLEIPLCAWELATIRCELG